MLGVSELAIREALRKEFLKLRESMSKTEVEEKSEDILKNLLKISEIRKARNILSYVSFRCEVDTHKLIKILLGQGIEVFVPKIVGEELWVAPIRSLEELEEGKYKILEPKDAYEPERYNIELVIVPGVVFSLEGYRLGYGKGFFDKLLKRLRQKQDIIAVGLAFEKQLVDSFPISEYDQKLDIIVTEKRIHRIRYYDL